MASAAIRAVGKAVGDRVTAGSTGPVRALVAAAVTGTATAVLTYRLLRGGGS
jgi:hypothetical protein